MKHLRRYNESLNGTPKLRKALEIYAEDLPFSMDNIHLEEMTTMKSKGCRSYRISYQHIDDALSDRIAHIEANAIDYEDHFARRRYIIDDVKKQVGIVFKKFAKKYDMIFSNPVVDMEDDNSITVWFDLLEINEE